MYINRGREVEVALDIKQLFLSEHKISYLIKFTLRFTICDRVINAYTSQFSIVLMLDRSIRRTNYEAVREPFYLRENFSSS